MATRTKKAPKRNRKGWHGNPRGGKTYAERYGKELKIRKLEKEIAQLEKKLGICWNPVPYHGDKEFTPWWYSGQRSKVEHAKTTSP